MKQVMCDSLKDLCQETIFTALTALNYNFNFEQSESVKEPKSLQLFHLSFLSIVQPYIFL